MLLFDLLRFETTVASCVARFLQFPDSSRGTARVLGCRGVWRGPTFRLPVVRSIRWGEMVCDLCVCLLRDALLDGV